MEGGWKEEEEEESVRQRALGCVEEEATVGGPRVGKEREERGEA